MFFFFFIEFLGQKLGFQSHLVQFSPQWNEPFLLCLRNLWTNWILSTESNSSQNKKKKFKNWKPYPKLDQYISFLTPDMVEVLILTQN